MTCLHDRHIQPLILAGLNGENWHLDDYAARGGYRQLRRILEAHIPTEQVIGDVAPGKCKARDVLRFSPHALIEVMAIGAYAMGFSVGYNESQREIWYEY